MSTQKHVSYFIKELTFSNACCWFSNYEPLLQLNQSYSFWMKNNTSSLTPSLMLWAEDNFSECCILGLHIKVLSLSPSSLQTQWVHGLRAKSFFFNHDLACSGQSTWGVINFQWILLSQQMEEGTLYLKHIAVCIDCLTTEVAFGGGDNTPWGFFCCLLGVLGETPKQTTRTDKWS